MDPSTPRASGSEGTGTRLPVVPLTEAAAWTQVLERVAAAPLAFCADFPAISRRFEAWWAHDVIDRPIFAATTSRRPERPITRRLELLSQPDAWFAAKLADMEQTHRVGDALPFIRADFGPVFMGALFGARVEFRSDTTWTHAFIQDDWTNAPDWALDENNPWWLLLRRLLEQVAVDAVGRYLVCTPDLGGAADVLLNLRGAMPLCFDVVERPEHIQHAVAVMYAAWRQAFGEQYRIVTPHGAGLVHWLGVWSHRPYVIPACDFNFMIRPTQFQRLFLPDIARVAATAGRAVFHLDGPRAAQHIDALLELPELQAIQFTPGAGTPSALAWVEMFRKIQQRRRSLWVICPPEEVLPLCDALPPEGLGIRVDTAMPPEQLDGLFAAFCRRYGPRSPERR